MIDINTEQLLTIQAAARLRPSVRQGRPTHPATIHRWITSGVRGVHLDAIRLGGSLFTSREALQRFAEALTAGGCPGRATLAGEVEVPAPSDQIVTCGCQQTGLGDPSPSEG